MWRDLDVFRRTYPSLRDAAAATQSLAFTSNADRTTQRYEGVFAKFVDFCREHGIPREEFFPAPPALAAMFIQDVASRGLRPSSLRITSAAIAWAHTVAGFPSPCDDPTLRFVLQGAQRANAGPVRNTVPISPEHLHELIVTLVDRGGVRALRLAAMVSIAFGALLRISELVGLTWRDVYIRQDGIIIVHVVKRKNDQAASGKDCKVPPGDAPYGVQAVIEAYAAALEFPFPARSKRWLWVPTDRVGAPDWLSQLGRTWMYDELRAELEAIGLSAADYSWHSFRAGAATAAADRGVPEPVLMAVGGWRSATAARTYVHYSDDTLLDAVRTATRTEDPVDSDSDQGSPRPASRGRPPAHRAPAPPVRGRGVPPVRGHGRNGSRNVLRRGQSASARRARHGRHE